MLSELWGFEVGDRVEVLRHWPGNDWQMGTVQGFTRERTLKVLLDTRELLAVPHPHMVRLWRAPTTADEIEAFLNGR